MFSIYGDIVVDPFLGTGTTMYASAITGRNCIGYELDNSFNISIVEMFTQKLKQISQDYISTRLKHHNQFIEDRQQKKKNIKHFNRNHNIPVITTQEKEIQFYTINKIKYTNNIYNITYNKYNQGRNENDQHSTK